MQAWVQHLDPHPRGVIPTELNYDEDMERKLIKKRGMKVWVNLWDQTFIIINTFIGNCARFRDIYNPVCMVVSLIFACLTILGRVHCNENPVYVFPEKELRGLSLNFHIRVSVCDLYIPRIGLHIFLTDRENI